MRTLTCNSTDQVVHRVNSAKACSVHPRKSAATVGPGSRSRGKFDNSLRS